MLIHYACFQERFVSYITLHWHFVDSSRYYAEVWKDSVETCFSYYAVSSLLVFSNFLVLHIEVLIFTCSI